MKRTSHRLLLAAALTFALPAFAAPDPNFHVFLCFGQGSNFGDKQKGVTLCTFHLLVRSGEIGDT